MKLHQIFFLLSLTCACVRAAEYRVADVAAFDTAVGKAKAGDIIVMESGEWKDAALLFHGQGKDGAPIVLRAAEAGKVKLTGDSSLRLSGEHLVVEGLWFHNAFPQKWDVVMFREDSKKLANHCTLRDCAITQDAATSDSRERKWISLYGAHHKIERCHFEGKTSKGTLLVAWLPEAQGEPPRHAISGNYFGPRLRLGKNGGEIIRIGDSDTSLQSAACVVRGNLFERCDGEVECISNKSCDNHYVGNTFIECQGTLTLRHGNRCIVEGNWFDGRHRKQTGGIRIIGEGHIVRGNLLQGLEGDGARSALCVMNGIENSPANGYLQVKSALVSHNWIEDCKHTIVVGFADEDVTATMEPTVTFERNVLVARTGTPAVQMLEKASKITWVDNTCVGTNSDSPPDAGFTSVTVADLKLKPLIRKLDRKDIGVPWMQP